MILDDADHPAVEGGRYYIGYIEMVDGYRHAYEAPVGKYGHRTVVRYSRTAKHPADPRCPECNPATTAPAGLRAEIQPTATYEQQESK